MCRLRIIASTYNGTVVIEAPPFSHFSRGFSVAPRRAATTPLYEGMAGGQRNWVLRNTPLYEGMAGGLRNWVLRNTPYKTKTGFICSYWVMLSYVHLVCI
jgi:hypothetical protein